MKKYIFLVVLCFNILAISSQRVVTIPGGIVPGDSLVYDQIFTFLKEDASNRVANPNTIYELERGKVYLTRSAVDANYDLHIRAGSANPEKHMPLVLHTQTLSGSNNTAILTARKNLKLENIEFDTQHADHTFGNRVIKIASTNSRAIFKGCRIVNDRGALVTIDSGDKLKLYINDCIMGNSGHFISVGGNGRLLDIRPNVISVDTVVIQNTTAYNYSDRMFRNMLQVINYVKLDHMSMVNIQGYHGCVQLGKTKEAHITNNIFANPLTYGDRIGARYTSEQLQPDKKFAVITHDSLASQLKSATVTLRNNNIYFDKKLEDFFNVVTNPDTVLYPQEVNSYIRNYHLPADVSKAYFKEPLTLKNTSSSDMLLDFSELYFENQNLGVYPNNFSSIYPFEWDVSYSTSSKSYTAGDDGYPLGDLNAWPELKARWEQKLPARVGSSPVRGIESIANFPNPFKTSIEFTYEVTLEQQVEISVFNLTGQLVATVHRAMHQPGRYQQLWEATDASGHALERGIYYVRYTTDNGTFTQKVIKD